MDYSKCLDYAQCPQVRRALQERQERELETALKHRWKHYPFPLQFLLDEHLKSYGLDAASHTLALVERTIGIYAPQARKSQQESASPQTSCRKRNLRLARSKSRRKKFSRFLIRVYSNWRLPSLS